MPQKESYDIDALRAKQPDALNQLVRQESPRVFRCIARLIHDKDEAQSLTQETFLQALLNLDSFRGESKLSTWLCAIGINLARAALRKSKRYDVVGDAEIERLLPSFSASGGHSEVYAPWNPEKQAEKNERISHVHAAINRLPDDYRMVVILRDLEELSTAETAQILGISEGAVRVRLHRARQALRTLLHDFFAT
jgi:RNA polymerase sigma-70 factor (ECF subfamily)